jgi:GST-like protein
MMSADYVLYGAPGTGSTVVEAALTLIGARYRGEDVAEPDLARAAFTPMAQVPALRLPDGRLMTESAAILIWLAEAHPAAKLAPAAGERRRADFLRWMAFVSAAIYALYWIRDDPSRVIDDPAGQATVKARLAERIAACWAVMEAGLEPGRYLLGDTLTVLDLYVTVVSRWTPRRRRFYETAPRMSEVVRRVDADPRLAEFWARRFPFSDGWEC